MLIISDRGSGFGEPEGSISAIAFGLAQTDGVRVNLRYLNDGTPVIFRHSAPGPFIAARPLAIGYMNQEEFTALRYESGREHRRPPFLEEVVRIVQNQPHARLFLELTAGYLSPEVGRVLEGIVDRTILIGDIIFTEQSLKRLGQRYQVGIIDARLGPTTLLEAMRLNARSVVGGWTSWVEKIEFALSMFTLPRRIRALHDKNIRFYLQGVNSILAARFFQRCGCDGFITDKPIQLKKALGE